MRVDPLTLRDLEVFQTSASGTGIFDYLDFTQTHQGRKRLRQRFERPPATSAELRDVQRAVRFLGAQDKLPWQLDSALADAADSYLGSNFITTAARGSIALAVATWWYELRYPDIVQKLRSGVSAVQHLLYSIQELVVAIARAGPPEGVLSHHINRYLQELRESGLDRLTTGSRGISGVDSIEWDRRLRGELLQNLHRMLDSAYELDALMSIAKANREHHLVLPEIIDDDFPSVAITGLRHLFVSEPHLNDCELGASSRVVLLTGPNMAGKSTYIKACALAVYLAHVGFGVPATAMRVSFFHRIAASIATTDNVRQGYSFFSSEVKRVSDITAWLLRGERTLVILDEPFKGTNVKDAADSTRLALESFAACRTSLFLIASHLAEVAHELQGVPGFRCGYFGAELRDGAPVYDYVLRAGVSSQRLGLWVIETMGLLAQLRALSEYGEARVK
jgi:DNA mismatch repair protein MutS